MQPFVFRRHVCCRQENRRRSSRAIWLLQGSKCNYSCSTDMLVADWKIEGVRVERSGYSCPQGWCVNKIPEHLQVFIVGNYSQISMTPTFKNSASIPSSRSKSRPINRSSEIDRTVQPGARTPNKSPVFKCRSDTHATSNLPLTPLL